MLVTSEQYKEAISAPLREFTSLVRLRLAPHVGALVTASSTMPGYDPGDVTRGRLSPEPSFGVGMYCPDYAKTEVMGWLSAEESDEEGAFAEPVKLTIAYVEEVPRKNFWIVGAEHNFPVHFIVRVMDAKGKVVLEIEEDENSFYVYGISLDEPIECATFELTILRTSEPESRAFVLSAGAVSDVVLSRDDLGDLQFLEETTSDYEGLPGKVSANELTFALANPGAIFSPPNVLGPFYGLLSPNVPVEAFFGLLVEENVFEYIPLGQFTVQEWRAPSEGLEAFLTCYDALYDLINQEVPEIRTRRNISVQALLRTLFQALGYGSDRSLVDSEIASHIPFGFVPLGTVGEAMDLLGELGDCYITVDRLNRLVTRPAFRETVPVESWDDEDHILSIDNPERFGSVHGGVTVKVYEQSVERGEDLANITELEIPSGETVVRKAEFSKEPVIQLESINLKGVEHAELEAASYGSGSVTLRIQNPGTETELANVQVIGTYSQPLKREYSLEFAEIPSDKRYTINNPLVQTDKQAGELARRVGSRLTDPFAIFELSVRGNPAIEAGDIVEIEAASSGIPKTKIEIIRINFSYDGGLEAQVLGRRLPDGGE